VRVRATANSIKTGGVRRRKLSDTNFEQIIVSRSCLPTHAAMGRLLLLLAVAIVRHELAGPPCCSWSCDFTFDAWVFVLWVLATKRRREELDENYPLANG
jgi:hypothetical protein